MSAQDSVALRLVELGEEPYEIKRFLDDNKPFERGTIDQVLAHLCKKTSHHALEIAERHRDEKILTPQEMHQHLLAISAKLRLNEKDEDGHSPDYVLRVAKEHPNLLPETIDVLVKVFTEARLFDFAIEAADLRPGSGEKLSESIADKLVSEGDLKSAASFRKGGKLLPKDIEAIVRGLLKEQVSYDSITKATSLMRDHGATEELIDFVVYSAIGNDAEVFVVDAAELGASAHVVDKLIRSLCEAGSHTHVFHAVKKLRPDRPLDAEEEALLIANLQTQEGRRKSRLKEDSGS